MFKLISIIIPVFNHAHTIERCLQSIAEQTYRPFEVIIVNDGSTDNFSDRDLLSPFRGETERGVSQIALKILHQPNQGAPAARNSGFAEATGEYVIFWDADTVGKPQMLGRLVKALERNPQASYAYSQFKFGWKKMKGQEFKAEDLKKYNFIDTTSLIRREALNTPSTVLPLNGGGNERYRVVSSALSPFRGETQRGVSGPFDTSLSRFQDWDLWLTLLEQNKTGTFVPEVLYTKIVQGRKGMSSWLPRVFYGLFGNNKKIKDYNLVREHVLRKHHLGK